MRFSNQDQSWLGDWLGVYGTTSRSSYSDAAEAARVGPADAARTHREFAHDLANRMVREAPDLVVKGLQANRLQGGTGSVGAPECRRREPGNFDGLRAGDRGDVVPGVSERLLVVGRGAGVGAVPRIERPGSGVDLFHAPLVAGIVLLPGVRVVRTWGETLTENNCSETVTVEVGVVDLQFSMSLSTYSALVGAEVTIEGVVRNRGTIGASAGYLRFFARDLEGEWDRIGSHFFQTLAAGSSATFKTTFEAPSVAGDYTHAACLTSSHVEWSCVFENLRVVSSSALSPRSKHNEEPE